MVDQEFGSACEGASPAACRCHGIAAAEAEARFFPPGDEVDDGAAAFAGGFEAVVAAEADGKQPAEAEAEAEAVVRAV